MSSTPQPGHCSALSGNPHAGCGPSVDRCPTTTLLGSAQRLAERTGSARAERIIVDCAQDTPQRLAKWAITNHVVPDGELAMRAHDLTTHYGRRAHLGMGRRHPDSGIRNAEQDVPDDGSALFETSDTRTSVTTVLNGGSRDIAGSTDVDGR